MSLEENSSKPDRELARTASVVLRVCKGLVYFLFITYKAQVILLTVKLALPISSFRSHGNQGKCQRTGMRGRVRLPLSFTLKSFAIRNRKGRMAYLNEVLIFLSFSRGKLSKQK